jgi:hypothetical protein
VRAVDVAARLAGGVDVAARLVAGVRRLAAAVFAAGLGVAAASTTAPDTSPVTTQFHRFPQPGCRVHISSRPTGNTSSNVTTVNHVDRYHGGPDTGPAGGTFTLEL